MYHSQVLSHPFQIMLNFPPVIQWTDEQFFEFCQRNRELRFEKTHNGDMLIMAPTGGETSCRNSELNMTLRHWAKKEGRGAAFDSSGGFILPNGAIRSPDAAWIKKSRLACLTPEQKTRFIPLCPDFVIELRSPSDRLSDLQNKMKEYMDNGALLGWLIDPVTQDVLVYRPGCDVERLINPSVITGEDVLPGFVMPLEDIWKPNF